MSIKPIQISKNPSVNNRIDGKRLEAVAEKIFQEHFIEIGYNDYSKICAYIVTDKTEYIDTQKIKSLEYYGYVVSLITIRNENNLIWHIFVNYDKNKPDKDLIE